MELRQIRSFLSIAETLHFGRSAEMIHLSQPALSLQIRALEDELACGTFLRICSKAASTAVHERPFTITRAPSAASWLATEKPMPLVEPDMRAVLLISSRFISLERTVWVVSSSRSP
jgi:Bacterial regulatory helix-turn-helix protein, lysR family